MKIRASKNAITSLYNDVGIEISGPKAVEKEFLTFFTKLMGKMMTSWNCIAITLIPKIPAPTQVKDYRPIACCTTLYKIIAKILTNILKKVIKVHVSRPWISSKVYQLGHGMCNHSFLFIGIQWRSYKPFQAKREISQGDPMSPYLFVIATEYLQREMNQLPMIKEFKYHPRCKKLGVTHICFSDDLLIFCMADINSLIILQETFQRFSAASGLQTCHDLKTSSRDSAYRGTR
ncbi:uncharacterized protein [Nicotiana tomentosiformis]|uniref:uncharacterized protein n=1 Tax=Nicotiana tomentosiformis TaxID=4098 RepID=UPI00388C6798